MGKIEKLKEINAIITETISDLETYMFINKFDVLEMDKNLKAVSKP